MIEPLHDALVEDALYRAEQAMNGCIAKPARWSLRVKILRKIVAKKRRRADQVSQPTEKEVRPL